MTGPAPALSPSSAGHLPVNGLDLYHEVYGELGTSPPLLLLPGAFMATGSMAAWVAGFAADRTVVVADMQGQGRTPDAPRALSYEQFADDAAALLRGLGATGRTCWATPRAVASRCSSQSGTRTSSASSS